MSEGENWGCPKWNQSDEYAGNTEWNELQWRWEFLRRKRLTRTTYLLKALAHWRETVSSEIPEQLLWEPAFEKLLFGLSPAETSSVGISPLPNPIYSWNSVWPDKSTSRSPLHQRSLNYWDISQASDDFQNWTKLIPIGGVAIAFDPNAPIEPQIEGLSEYLASLRHHSIKTLTRLHKSKRLQYLRVLDAREQNASYQQITEILQHTQKTPQAVRDIVTQAEKYRDSL
ncbi:MAG: hypothetical protein P1U83_06300 [Roseovarius sp.]|nr:hypothetical protein [Roseovarius sp.]